MHFSRFLAFLLLASLLSAQIPMNESLLGMLNGTEGAFVQKLFDRMNASGFSSLSGNSTLIVMGSSTTGTEKALFESVKAAYPSLGNATVVPDSQDSLGKIDSGSYALVVLIGGPSQNLLAGEMESRKILNQSEEVMGQFIAHYGETEKGTLVAVVSDKRGYSNAARVSVKYSPLAAFMPPEYVPLAATAVSLVLLSLINVVRTVFEFKALDLGRKGRKVGEGSVFMFGLNLSEIGAIVLASLILGISISWQYFGPTPEFVLWAFINTAICLLAAIMHEVTHRIFAHFFKIKVEYRFWPAGSFLTLLSSYLGNAFSIQGFILEEIPKETAKWKVGLMKLAAPLLSNAVMLFFAILNVFFPHAIFQSIYTISALWAIAEMLPFGALDGTDIKEWNFFVWLFSFLFVAASYIFVTFVL